MTRTGGHGPQTKRRSLEPRPAESADNIKVILNKRAGERAKGI